MFEDILIKLSHIFLCKSQICFERDVSNVLMILYFEVHIYSKKKKNPLQAQMIFLQVFYNAFYPPSTHHFFIYILIFSKKKKKKVNREVVAERMQKSISLFLTTTQGSTKC
jgi:hypothetical protein